MGVGVFHPLGRAAELHGRILIEYQELNSDRTLFVKNDLVPSTGFRVQWLIKYNVYVCIIDSLIDILSLNVPRETKPFLSETRRGRELDLNTKYAVIGLTLKH